MFGGHVGGGGGWVQSLGANALVLYWGTGSGEPECPGPRYLHAPDRPVDPDQGGLPLHPDRCIIDVSYSSVGEAGVWSFFKRFRSQLSTKIFRRACSRPRHEATCQRSEKQGFRVVGGISYDDARHLIHIFNVKSCWLVSVDGAEDSATRWQILEEVLAAKRGKNPNLPIFLFGDQTTAEMVPAAVLRHANAFMRLFERLPSFSRG